MKSSIQKKGKPASGAASTKGGEGKAKSSGKKRWGGGWMRFFVGVGVVVLFVLLVPIWQVAMLRWGNPTTTGTAVQRWCEEGFGVPLARLQWVDSRRIPQSFFRFVWLAEDQRFFEHGGFDWIEMQKAWEAREEGGRGASTITMQVARTLFLWQGRSWVRKVLEAYYTVWMELVLDKKRIFELYVNAVELGAGIHGLGAASGKYYDRNPLQLSLKEQALLVGCLPAPLMRNPLKPDENLRERQGWLLEEFEKTEFPAELTKLGKR